MTPRWPDHPLAAAFPLLSPAELESLAADIERNGLRHPVVVYEGAILDGRNRCRACDPDEAYIGRDRPGWFEHLPTGGRIVGGDGMGGYVRFEGSRDEAAALVWSENAERRHLTDAAKVEAHDMLFPPQRGRPGNVPQFGKIYTSAPADAERRINVGKRTVENVRRVRHAVAAGDAAAELHDAMITPRMVVRGDGAEPRTVTPSDAVQVVQSGASPSVQSDAVRKWQSGAVKTVAEHVHAVAGRVYIASSARDDWETPPEVFDPLHKRFRFTVDGAATADNRKVARWWSDAFAQPWTGERVFANPPYGRQQVRWIEEAAKREAELVALLIPARPDTRAWQELILPRAEVWFLRGRINFLVGGEDSGQGGSPMPPAVVLMRPSDPPRRTKWRAVRAGTLADILAEEASE